MNIRYLALPLIAAVGLGGCGSAKLKHEAASPQVTKDEAQAQRIVQRCVSKSNVLSHQGRQAFIHCISPPGKEAQVERCAQHAFATDGVLTSRARTKLEGDISRCIL